MSNESRTNQRGELTRMPFAATQFPISFSEDWKNGNGDGEFLTTLNRDRPEGRVMLMAALNGEVPGLESVLNTEITVAGVTMHPASKIDPDTGEIIHMIRVILHCADGKSFQSYGDGVLKSLRLLASMLGSDVWKEPRKCTPKRVQTSGSRSMHRLEWKMD
jgi:hypothetical protein